MRDIAQIVHKINIYDKQVKGLTFTKQASHDLKWVNKTYKLKGLLDLMVF